MQLNKPGTLPQMCFSHRLDNGLQIVGQPMPCPTPSR